ncbi:dipeptidase [Vermiculatibacterium agrestimuris]|uniref:dipeptidase n=1 Tax=Vermiculatibacterium agrestimuris TaxID=2941519 RepID=UPI00203BB22C|nr:dipeptidase [Vermiculatibacterium agrestimuris]
MQVFDGHCDTLLRCYRQGGGFRENSGHLDLKRMGKLGKCAQFFAVFGSPDETPGCSLWEVFLAQEAIFRREMAANSGLVTHCRTAGEAEAAWAAGKQAAFLSVEGAELLECDLQKLEEAYHMGVRAVNLTWNHENHLSGSNNESSQKGLTEQGKSFVRRMQELGMLVDVSHLSDPGFWDVMELARKPVFASHSNSRAICPHKRNLTDEQFTAIIGNHGVAGLNMAAEFVGQSEPTIDTVVAHIEHWLSLGGGKNISLGGDWDGIKDMPRGIAGFQDLEAVAERLLRMNYPEQQVKDLFYNNLMRVVREVCTM